MVSIPEETHRKLKSTVAGLERERLPWWRHWRTLADYYLPRRYVWLLSDAERRQIETRNRFILDGTGTQAARTLASGMMNGITSPARPWFRLRLLNQQGDESIETRQWLDEVERRMLFIFAESNFYNSMAVLYLDLSVFGTAAMTIYEDFEDVINCTNHALGEYYLGLDPQGRVNLFARQFQYTVRQLVDEFGEDNVSPGVADAWKKSGESRLDTRMVVHVMQPNRDDELSRRLPRGMAWREVFWEKSATSGSVLALRGYRDFPTVAPRWEVTANDAYGSSPGMDALGDVIQLQHETKRKAQALDFVVRPPLVADIQLQHRQTALLPGGLTYVAGQNNAGIKPAYEVRPDLQALTADIREVQARIREIFHNDLFQMISQLETVRSATEIDARREEKLVLLGPVLERFEQEALEPAIERTFNIMARNRLLPPAPQELAGQELEVQFVSILNAAQSALNAAPTERVLSFAGELAGARPDVLDRINFDETLTTYARDVGAKASILNSDADVEEIRERRAQQQQAAQQAEAALAGVDAAKQLSETDVGGGANALQRLLNG